VGSTAGVSWKGVSRIKDRSVLDELIVVVTKAGVDSRTSSFVVEAFTA